MDTTGTFETAKVLGQMQVLTALHKFYSVEDWGEHSKDIDFQNIVLTIGSSSEELEKGKELLGLYPEVNFVCLDVANGYREHFIEAVSKARTEFPEKIIIQYKFYYLFYNEKYFFSYNLIIQKY